MLGNVADDVSAIIKRIQGSDAQLVSVRRVLQKRKVVRQTAAGLGICWMEQLVKRGSEKDIGGDAR